MTRVLLACFLTIVLLCLSACVEGTPFAKPPVSHHEGLGLDFEAPGGTKLQRSFHLAVGEEFEAKCTLYNYSTQPNDYLATLLLDYQQVPFEWNGTEKVVHCFSLKGRPEGTYTAETRPGETYTLKTPPLAEGYHEFMLLFFWHPFYYSASLKWRRESIFMMTDWRVNLYVGDVGHPLKEFPLYSGSKAEGSQPPFLSTQGIKGYPFLVWGQKAVKPNELVDYFVYLSHGKEENLPFALIYFLNYQQIPPNPGSEGMVTFGTLPGLTQTNIAASFEAPAQPGPYELVVVLVPHPYAQLENPPGVRTIPNISYASQRPLITVEES